MGQPELCGDVSYHQDGCVSIAPNSIAGYFGDDRTRSITRLGVCKIKPAYPALKGCRPWGGRPRRSIASPDNMSSRHHAARRALPLSSVALTGHHPRINMGDADGDEARAGTAGHHHARSRPRAALLRSPPSCTTSRASPVATARSVNKEACGLAHMVDIDCMHLRLVQTVLPALGRPSIAPRTISTRTPPREA
ncbi:hypothetical protein AURDEDRAFT_160984 [Auricularia subglabra TFB-10046 SS5]|nr:hypothetical protein AURDEDRAFT_160984 [Auricularia subglabra TFB-10046 SS5]